MQRLLIVASALLVGLPTLAVGQDEEDAPDPPQAETEPEADPEASEPVRLAPVVVTARKWEEEMQDLPQSITVIPETLIRDAGLNTIRDASIYVPNLNMTEFTSRRLSFPFIRGIGSGQGDPAVTTYVDGVPQLAISSTNIPLLDVERIEFLRGPQGTLYGRNSLGGLIHVITRPPSNTPEFDADLTVGNKSLIQSDFRANMPLVEDELHLSLSSQFLRRDGYATNDFTGDDVDSRDSFFGRAQVLWTPDEANEVRIGVYGERARDGGFALNFLEALDRRPHHINQNFQGVAERDIVAPSITWNYSGSAIDFTSITAYQYWDVLETSDFDFTPIDGVERRTSESLNGYIQELRVASAEDAPVELGEDASLRWLAGTLVFVSRSDRSATNELLPGGVGPLFLLPGTQRDSGSFDDVGVGVFGQATLTLDRLDLTAGLRWDYEDKEADLNNRFVSGGVPFFDVDRSPDESYDEWLPSFNVAYRWSEQVMTYALAARGFKAGGFNLNAPAGELAYSPETSWTYEGGIKTSWFDDKLLVNAAYFYIDWDDMQLSQFDEVSGGYVTNAGRSTSKGVELEVIGRPIEGLDLFATFGYTDATFDSFVDSYGMDASGNDLPFAPETTYSVGAQYTLDLDRSTRLYVLGEYVAIGDFNYDAGNIEDESYGLANFRAGVGRGPWRVEGWIRNAFDEDYVPVAFQPSPVDPTIFVGESGAPRTYGVTVSLTF